MSKVDLKKKTVKTLPDKTLKQKTSETLPDKAAKTVKTLPDKTLKQKTSETLMACDAPEKRKHRRKHPKVYTDDYIAHLYDIGVEQCQIAQLAGVTTRTIERKLSGHEKSKGLLDIFKQKRADILASVQLMALKRIQEALSTVEVSSSADIKQLATAMGIFYDKERLERGQVTEITEIRVLEASLKDLIEERERLLGVIPSKDERDPSI